MKRYISLNVGLVSRSHKTPGIQSTYTSTHITIKVQKGVLVSSMNASVLLSLFNDLRKRDKI